MRTVRWGIGIILSSCIVSFGAHALEVAGEVVSVHGTAYVRQDGATQLQKPIALKPAQNVYAGDVINTSSDGAVKILLKDKSIVDLGASSLFKVEKFAAKEGGNREVDLDMKFGRLRVSVSKKITGTGKFNVKTRAATMGVRGTEFVVDSALGDSAAGKTAPKTDVTVLQGKVDVQGSSPSGAAAKINSLVAGNQISTQVGLTSSMIKLNDTQLAQVASVGKVEDNTFTKAITIEVKPESKASADRMPASDPAKGGEAPVAGSIASEVAAMAAEAPSVPVSFSEIGVPGAPSVVNINTSPVNQVNQSYRVTVVVGQ